MNETNPPDVGQTERDRINLRRLARNHLEHAKTLLDEAERILNETDPTDKESTK